MSGLRAPRIGLRRATGLLTVAFMLWQMVWAVATPGFRTPDEPAHYNSVLRIATTGQWPEPGQVGLDIVVVDAVYESGLTTASENMFALINRSEVAGGEARARGLDVASFQEADISAHGDRTIGNYRDAEVSGTNDQMTQHPPLYYLLVGTAARLVGALDWTWDRQLLLLRVLSILLTSPLVPCLVYTASRLGVGRRASLAIGGTVFLVPQLAFNTAAVTNDDLAIGAGALTIAACAAAMYSGTWRTVAAAGIALGIGLWSKGTFIPMGLVVGCAFLVNSGLGPFRRRLARGLAAGGLGVIIGGYWWVHNVIHYGVVQPAGMERNGSSHGTDLGFFLRRGLTDMADSSWGKFGWLEYLLPRPQLLVLQLAILLLVIGAITRGRVVLTEGRMVRADRLRRFVLVLFYPATATMLFLQAWTAYQQTGAVPGVQGRYLFPGIVGLLAVVGTAYAPILERPPFKRWRYAIPGVVSAVVAGSALLLWLRACYPSEVGRIGVDWMRWSLVAALDTRWLHVIVLFGGLTLLIAVLIPLVVGDDVRENTLTPEMSTDGAPLRTAAGHRLDAEYPDGIESRPT